MFWKTFKKMLRVQKTAWMATEKEHWNVKLRMKLSFLCTVRICVRAELFSSIIPCASHKLAKNIACETWGKLSNSKFWLNFWTTTMASFWIFNQLWFRQWITSSKIYPNAIVQISPTVIKKNLNEKPNWIIWVSFWNNKSESRLSTRN